MLLHHFNQGGPLMWPLLACSVALAAALAERVWAHATWRRGRAVSPATAARPGIHPFFWEVPPQIGLLGTVIGLVQIFRGGLGAEAFGIGVGVACITTVFGLGLALVARSADHFFVAWAAGRGIKKEETILCSNTLLPQTGGAVGATTSDSAAPTARDTPPVHAGATP